MFDESLVDEMRAIVTAATSVSQIVLATATLDENFEGRKLKQILGKDINFVKHSTY